MRYKSEEFDMAIGEIKDGDFDLAIGRLQELQSHYQTLYGFYEIVRDEVLEHEKLGPWAEEEYDG